MLNKNKYWRSLLGSHAEALIAKQTAYTDSTDIASFVADAVEGEIGIFKASDGTAYDGSAAASTTETIFAAIKRDGFIEKTSTFTVAGFSPKRQAYSAPVAQVTKVTFSGTPVKGNFYQVRLRDLTPGYQPFPTWDYHYVAKTGDTQGDVAAAIVAAINDTTSLENRNTDPIATAVAGQGVSAVAVTNGGSSYTSAPTVSFTGGGGTGATATATIDTGTGKVTGVTITNAGSGYTSAPTVAFAGGAGTGAAATASIATDGTIVITANGKGPSFGISYSADALDDLDAMTTYTTGASWGSGSYDQVAELERETDVIKGVTTQYPQEGIRPEEYGAPTAFANSTSTYNIYVLIGEASDWTPLPITKQTMKRQILLAIPSTGTTPDTAIKTILGV